MAMKKKHADFCWKLSCSGLSPLSSLTQTDLWGSQCTWNVPVGVLKDKSCFFFTQYCHLISNRKLSVCGKGVFSHSACCVRTVTVSCIVRVSLSRMKCTIVIAALAWCHRHTYTCLPLGKKCVGPHEPGDTDLRIILRSCASMFWVQQSSTRLILCEVG